MRMVSNILDEIKNFGENEVRDDLASFSCPKNQEIETFIREKAIDFANRKLSITYLVVDEDDGQIFNPYTC